MFTILHFQRLSIIYYPHLKMEKLNDCNHTKKSFAKMNITETLYTGFNRIKPLLIGQLLSLLLASSGAANDSLHFECNLSAPSLQAGLMYFCLSFALIGIFTENRRGGVGSISTSEQSHDDEAHVVDHERHSHQISSVDVEEYDNDYDDNLNNQATPCESLGIQGFCQKISNNIFPCHSIIIKGSPLMYFVMALLDVQANYFTFLAYRYTTLTSVSLLDAVGIPSSMVFSRLLLRRVYKVSHVLGAAICVAGVIVNVFVDYRNEKRGFVEEDDGIVPDFPNQMKGDIFAVIGAIIYGLNNVLTERSVKHIGGIKEYLGMLGLYGAIISLIQGLILDRQAVMTFFTRKDDICSAAKGFGLLFYCVFFGVASYVGISIFLTESEAAFLNLSLLTADLWVVAFTVVMQSFIPSYHFWLALVLIFIGVILYEVSGEPIHYHTSYDDIQRNNNGSRRDEDISQYLSELEIPDQSDNIIT